MVESQLFESLLQCVIHQNNNFQDWFCKKKFPKKSYGGKTLEGADLPPSGHLGLKGFSLHSGQKG